MAAEFFNFCWWKVRKNSKAIWFLRLEFFRTKHDLRPILTCRTRNSATQKHSAPATARNLLLSWSQLAPATLSYICSSSFRISALISVNPMWPGGGGLARPPLGVISCHSVEDAPTNSKFLDFSQFDPYFHLVKSVFTFFCNFYPKISVKFFFRPKKYWFFDENGQKPFFSQKYCHFLFQLCNQYALRNFLRRITYL